MRKIVFSLGVIAAALVSGAWAVESTTGADQPVRGWRDIEKGKEIAASIPLTGSWSDVTCDNGQPDRCGGFVLYLFQKDRRLCGDHFFSTMGAGQLNEGAPKSVVGAVTGSTAVVSITSGRDKSIFRAKISRVGNTLLWRRLKQVKSGEIDESLIPEKARLQKSGRVDDAENLKRVIDQCDQP